MRILIIEDDENKGGQLMKFIGSLLPDTPIALKRSLSSAMRALRDATWDLIVLDMSIPTYDPGPDEPGGQSHHFGGREILNQMKRFDIDVPVIVVTQYETFGYPNPTSLEQLDSQMRAEHDGIYRGAVYYNAAINGWQDQLRSLIEGTTSGD